ncbi:hypothetical protein SAMN06298226_1341 [Nitrosovibrio sp. Nv4]|nr:hypothetical protein SAMN06298226_1341 [Nitrosovibrio sp. Nv4]
MYGVTKDMTQVSGNRARLPLSYYEPLRIKTHRGFDNFSVVASDNPRVSVLNLLPTGISFQLRQFAVFS